MVRVAAELREALASILQVSPPDNPAVPRLIDSYRDIARELGQQCDVERVLHDLLPAGGAGAQVPPVEATDAGHTPRSTTPHQTSWKPAAQ